MSRSDRAPDRDVVELAFGKLRYRDGGLELITPVSTVRCELPVEGTSDELVSWAGEQWCCVVWDAGSDVVVADGNGPALRPVGRIERLDFGGGYDPGGMHRVQFHPVGNDLCLIETEIGVGLVDRRAGIVWYVVHGDPTTRVERAGPDRVVTVSETSVVATDTATGKVLDTSPADG